MKFSLILSFIVFSLCYSDSLLLTVQPDLSDLNFVNEGGLQKIVLSGFPFLGMEGEPDLPFMPLNIAIPTGCMVTNLHIQNCSYDTLHSSFRIAPVVPIICSIGFEKSSSAMNEEIYSYSNFYPKELYKSWQPGILWGLPIVTTCIRPIQWNPATGQLRTLRDVEIVVEYEPDPNPPIIRTRTQWSEDRAREILESIVINPLNIAHSGAVIVEPRNLEYGQYVIVTDSEYLAPMQELADWKTAKGIPSQVFTTAWIQSSYPFIDLQQSVRAFLTDCRSEGVDFVLIAGDNDTFEARFTYPSQSSQVPLPSDLYYADNNDIEPGRDSWDSNGNGYWGEDSDNVEWHPDMWVGRASVNSLEESEIFVDKVLISEHVQEVTTPQCGFDWPEDIGFGYTTGYLHPGSNPGSVYAEQISDYVSSSWWEEKCYESYGNNSTAITIAMINSGPDQVFHANHGAPTCMYTAYGDSFTVDDILQLQNISNTSIVAVWNSIACSIGAFDTLTSCADAWLNAPQGGGFACMNARSVYAYHSFSICERFYSSFLIDGVYELGIAHGLSIDHLCPPSYTTIAEIVQGNNLFGDPELPMRTAPSCSMTVNYPEFINGTCQIQVQVFSSDIPVENARVCLQKGTWQTGEIYEVAYTDVSGKVFLWAAPQTLGDINLTVWAHNYDPYFGSITVNSLGAQGQEQFERTLMNVIPNPSSSHVSLQFSLQAPSFVELRIFDISGHLISITASGQFGEGIHEVVVDNLASGIYFVQMQSGSFSAIQRFLVLD